MSSNPRQIIEKTTKYIRNPDVAKFQEMQETNEHLGDIKDSLKGSSAFKAGDFIENFLNHIKGDKGDKPEYKKDYLTEEELSGIIREIESKIRVPQDGKTPIKNVDYFTDEEVQKIVDDITSRIRIPEDGKNADEETIIQQVLAKIPVPQDGKPGKNGENPDPKIVAKEALKILQSLKGDERPSLKMFKESDDLIGTVSLHKNMMRNMPKSLIDGDQRWGGHGVVLNAGTNVTITKNSDGSYTVNSTGGGGTWTSGSPSGTQNGVNTTFTLPSTPASILLLYLNGQFLTGGGVDYTLSGSTITTVNAPFSTDVFTYNYQ